MASANLLRLTDDFDDPREELRHGLNQATRAAWRLLEQAVDRSPVRRLARFIWAVQVEVVETDSLVKVTLNDLAEIDGESISIILDAHDLLHFKLQAKRASKPRMPAKALLDGFRPLERHLALPPGVDRKLATAKFENGRITVTLPKRTVEPKEDSSVRTRAA